MTAIDGESLESFSIHFPPFRIEAQIVWNDDMRAVHLTCHLVFHPKDKGKNSSDRHVKLFVNHLPRTRGVIDGAGKLWILEHRSDEHTSELQSLMRISYAVF